MELINLKMSSHGGGKARVPAFDGKIESYEEFEMQWTAFAQEEGFSDALMAKGHPDTPTDYKTAIPDEGQGQGHKEAKGQEGKCQSSCILHSGIQNCEIESHDKQGRNRGQMTSLQRLKRAADLMM
jgi:hypothetical protein